MSQLYFKSMFTHFQLEDASEERDIGANSSVNVKDVNFIILLCLCMFHVPQRLLNWLNQFGSRFRLKLNSAFFSSIRSSLVNNIPKLVKFQFILI